MGVLPWAHHTPTSSNVTRWQGAPCKRGKGNFAVRGTGRAADGRNGRTPKCGDGRGKNRWFDRGYASSANLFSQGRDCCREPFGLMGRLSAETTRTDVRRNSREQVEVSHGTNQNAIHGARSAEQLRGLWAHCSTRAMLEVGKGIAATMRGGGVAVCSGVLI